MNQPYLKITTRWAWPAPRLRSVSMCLLVLTGLCLAVMAASAPDATPQVTLIAEQRIAIDSTLTTYRFVPAENLVQGQEVHYTLRISNPSEFALREVQVTQAVPGNTRYVEKSATGSGAELSFSIDDGQSFAGAGALKNPDGSAAQAAQVTHIRWQFPYSLPPQSVVLARFRAVFQ